MSPGRRQLAFIALRTLLAAERAKPTARLGEIETALGTIAASAPAKSTAPLPWRGLDDQHYATQPRPAFPSDALHEQYNTRWIGPKTFARRTAGAAR